MYYLLFQLTEDGIYFSIILIITIITIISNFNPGRGICASAILLNSPYMVNDQLYIVIRI